MTDIVISRDLAERIMGLIYKADTKGAFGPACDGDDPCEVCEVVAALVTAPTTSGKPQPGQQFGSSDPHGTDTDSQRRTSGKNVPRQGAPEL